MMSPLELCTMLEKSYRNFLLTNYRFKDPDLNRTFNEALGDAALAKGPFLEAAPPFSKGRFPAELFSELLGHTPEQAFLDAVKNRSLYMHQDRAIEKVFSGRNVIVSTGTGSGKTESFLYPILLDLYSEYEAGTLGPGVRALVLYPLNALANDQRDRLGEIAECLGQSGFQFTFGQYIGETPEDEKDTYRRAEEKARERKHGELVFRKEMRENPPHILLTNFSMLEYLLLRPDDSPLFMGKSARSWRYLVLDEVHQYRGAVGHEMSLLLARLKQRLREGGSERGFRCIGTSATLADGEDGFADVARFASTLFGEPFEAEDVISASLEKLPDETGHEPACTDYSKLARLVNQLDKGDRSQSGDVADQLNEELQLILDRWAVKGVDGEPPERRLGRVLMADSRATRLRERVNGNPEDIRELAADIFPELPSSDGSALEAFFSMIRCLAWAVHPDNGEPFGSPRYHYFLRALEGAFVSYLPHKQVFVDRIATTSEGVTFETAVCQECGQHYFVGHLQQEGGLTFLKEPIRDPGDPDSGLSYLMPLEPDGEKDENSDSEEILDGYLCVECGAYSDFEFPDCGHSPERMLHVIREEPEETGTKGREKPYRCSACGAVSPNTPIRDVISGSDAPHSVIATTFHNNLEPDRKKILAFADGRQDAAFFAWYLENSYSDLFHRCMIFDAADTTLKNDSSPTLEDLMCEVVRSGSKQGLFRRNDSRITKEKACWTWLLREVLSNSRRISLEGVGLVRWFLELPDTFTLPVELTREPFGFSQSELFELTRFLLDSLRLQGAVDLSLLTEGAIAWDEIGLLMGNKLVNFGKPSKRKDICSWLTSGGRKKFMKKIFMARDMAEDEALAHADKFLRGIWQAVIDWDDRNAEDIQDRILVPVQGFSQLNLKGYRVKRLSVLYQCEVCRQLQYSNLVGHCRRSSCSGRVRQVETEELPVNHYRKLYTRGLDSPLSVEEHTAQLNHDKAREFQRRFKEGKINVLSCSTTFELGVDLGDLDNVFLRNVPPEAFNYAQRVGRAGRRRGFPGLAVTFCKRSPHDLYHFSDPLHIIRGSIRPPVLNIVNEKIAVRHIAAVVLSHFLRNHPDRFRDLESFCGGDLLHPDAVDCLRNHVADHLPILSKSLAGILPERFIEEFKVGTEDRWVPRICGPQSRMVVAEQTLKSDFTAVHKCEKESSRQGQHGQAGWAQRMQGTIKKRNVLSFLSTQTVIPKYGFPVDVVELETWWGVGKSGSKAAGEVSLQRDLSMAISEFAPSSSVIANKKEWKSFGLKKVAGKEWEKRYYKRCPVHNCYVQWKEGQKELDLECGCSGRSGHVIKHAYIVPSFGFVVSKKDEGRDPRFKPRRLFSTRPYFAGPCATNAVRPDVILFDEDQPVMKLKPAQPGLMAVVCEGRKGQPFYICDRCGCGMTSPPAGRKRDHENHMGRSCQGKLRPYMLGHEFITDVLQISLLPPVTPGVSALELAYSLAYSLLEGASEALQVPSSDLNVTVGKIPQDGTVPPIILYDDVPGGAGIVSSLEDPNRMRKCLTLALKRVTGGCGCQADTSCYGCLRSYRNQFVHRYLKRGLAAEYLSQLLRM